MKYNGLTELGRKYLAKIQANREPVKFVKIKFGNGTLQEHENPADFTDVKNIKVEKSILELKQSDDAVKLTTQIDNVGLNEGYYPRETGIYVLDDDREILYYYINDGTEVSYLPPEASGPVRFDISINLIATSDTAITVRNDGKDLYITKEYLEKELAKKISKVGGVITGGLIIKRNKTDHVTMHFNDVYKGALIADSTYVALWNNAAQTSIQLNDDGTVYLPSVNLSTTSKEVVGAINELESNKLEKGGYTGNAKNLNDEISKKATPQDYGRVKVGKYLYAQDGRLSVNVQLDPAQGGDGLVAGAESVKKLNDSKLDKTGGKVTGSITVDVDTNNNIILYKNGELKGIVTTGSGYIGMYNNTSKRAFQLNDDGGVTLQATNLTTTSKEVVGAVNELERDKLEKGGYTGTAKNLNDEISKKATTQDYGRVKVGKYLYAQDGRLSVNVQLDPAQGGDGSVAGAESVKKLNDSKLDKTGGKVTGSITVDVDTNNNIILYKNGELKGIIGAGSSYISMYNSTSKKALQLNDDGGVTLQATNLTTSSKDVVGAINELNKNFRFLGSITTVGGVVPVGDYKEYIVYIRYSAEVICRTIHLTNEYLKKPTTLKHFKFYEQLLECEFEVANSQFKLLNKGANDDGGIDIWVK